MNKKNYFNNLIKNYGIGNKKLFFFCNKLGLNNNFKKSIYLNKIQSLKLTKYTNNSLLNSKLKERVKKEILFPQKIRVYKGLRNKYKYPCRGQRTKTNAKTKKRCKI